MAFKPVVVACAVLLIAFAAPAQGQAVPGNLTANATAFVGYLATAPAYSTLLTAVQAANLTNAAIALANSSSGITLFAPTNAAFNALGAPILSCLTAPTGINLLTAILSYHVVPQNLPAAAILAAVPINVTTASNQAVAVTVVNGTVILNGATRVISPNNFTNSAGTIHGIDSVLLPPNGLANVTALCSSAPSPAAAAPGPVATRTPTPTVAAPAGSFTGLAPTPTPASGAAGLSLSAGLSMALLFVAAALALQGF